VKCLGSGTYSAQIRVVGTGEIVEEIATNEIISGTWNRLTNRTSKCTLSLPVMGTSSDKCCRFVNLGRGIPAYEVYLWRNTESGGNQRVWAGPLTDLEVQPGNVINLTAQDRSWWLSKRLIGTKNYVSLDINDIARQMAEYGYGLNNPANVVVAWEAAGIVGEKTPAESEGSLVLNQITDVLDNVSYWTCVLGGFRIGMKCEIPWTFTDEDIAEVPPLIWSADSYSTQVFARTNGAAFASSGGVDTTRFGFPVLVQNVIDANATNDIDAQGFTNKSLAERKYAGPQLQALNSTLTANMGIDIMELIPGCKARVNFEQYCDPIARELYLTQVEGAFNPEDEDIRIELSQNYAESSVARVSGAS